MGALTQVALFGTLIAAVHTWGVAYVAYLASAVVWVGRFFVARVSAEKHNDNVLRFGRGWAIGSWFTPILSLWRPCQMMRRPGPRGGTYSSACGGASSSRTLALVAALLAIVVVGRITGADDRRRTQLPAARASNKDESPRRG